MGYYFKEKNIWGQKYLKHLKPLCSLENDGSENERYKVLKNVKMLKWEYYKDVWVDEVEFLDKYSDDVEWDGVLDKQQLRIFTKWLHFKINENPFWINNMNRDEVVLEMFRHLFLKKKDPFINKLRYIK